MLEIRFQTKAAKNGNDVLVQPFSANSLVTKCITNDPAMICKLCVMFLTGKIPFFDAVS